MDFGQTERKISFYQMTEITLQLIQLFDFSYSIKLFVFIAFPRDLPIPILDVKDHVDLRDTVQSSSSFEVLEHWNDRRTKNLQT